MNAEGEKPVRTRQCAIPAVLRQPWCCLAALTVVALVARLYQLATPVLRWDEGWSLAHATLPWSQLTEIALADRHPPLYFALLKLWLITGKSTWGIRFLSVIPGVLAVPLMYHVARAWMKSRNSGSSGTRVSTHVPLFAAAFAALWPLLVYYGQVARMYSWSALFVLAAAWFALDEGHAGSGSVTEQEPVRKPALQSAADIPARRPLLRDIGLVLSSAASLYTLYHTAWVIAGLWLYVLILHPRRFLRLALLAVATLALYSPWIIKALSTIGQRMSTDSASSPSSLLDWLRLLVAPIEGLAFVQGSGRRALVALGIVLAAAFTLGRPSRADGQKLLLPLLVLGLSVVGVAIGSQQLWFAPRHLVPATPFLGLALAWALDRLTVRWWPLGVAAVLGLAIIYGPASTHFVYEKTLEVVDPFDPTLDYRYLSEHAGPDDLVYFNALAKAGWYENLRGPQDPTWSYAMRWEPIIEPLEDIAARIQRDAASHQRLWFVLYNGDYGPNAELVAWLAENLSPAGSAWQGDTLYLAYAAPAQEDASYTRTELFANGIRLSEAHWSSTVPNGGAATVTLAWETDQTVPTSYKVFVHLVDASGRVIAQHDGLPAVGTHATDTWSVGETILDRHGLFLPADAPTELYLRVGLYDPATGERLLLSDGISDSIELGAVTVELRHVPSQ